MHVPHPDYLPLVLSAEQFLDWLDFYSREPWGSPVDDNRTLLVAHSAQSAMATDRPIAADYLPHLASRPKREQTPEETVAAMEMIAIVLGANCGTADSRKTESTALGQR